MCQNSTCRRNGWLVLVSLTLLAVGGTAHAQEPAAYPGGVRPDWRRIGNSSFEAFLASAATGQRPGRPQVGRARDDREGAEGIALQQVRGREGARTHSLAALRSPAQARSRQKRHLRDSLFGDRQPVDSCALTSAASQTSRECCSSPNPLTIKALPMSNRASSRVAVPLRFPAAKGGVRWHSATSKS